MRKGLNEGILENRAVEGRRTTDASRSSSRHHSVTANHHRSLICFAAPSVDVLPRRMAEDRVAHLGPDLMAGAEPDWDDVVRRARED